MNCIYCNNKKLYNVNDTQVKCARCHKKFSKVRVEREQKIFECFSKGVNASICAKELELNYITVHKHYQKIRKNIINQCEKNFQNQEVQGYDEYIYIEKSKIKKNELFRAKDCITFLYGDGKIYNLLMPELSRYQDIENKELKRFLGLNKLQSKKENLSTIEKFWQYFEEEIVKYKGVSDENFFGYLKEFEWRFNGL